MRISPHVCFDGKCEEAFRYYQGVLGGTIVTMLTYGASPLAATTPLELHGRILHATLALDGVELTGVDVAPNEYLPPRGFFVTLNLVDEVESVRVFNSLAQGGKILMEYQATFWSAGFAVLIDRFAVPWEINCMHATGKKTFP